VESAILTGLGLSPSAGLNAYIPLITLALADRLTDRINLDNPYDFISSNLGIAILLFLLTIELVVDKVPGTDHLNDIIQTVIRPVAGAFLMIATTNQQGDSFNAVVAGLIGVSLSGAVHSVKATARPAITASTGGFGNPLVSLVEDGIAAMTSVLAILVPILAIILLSFSCLVLWFLYRRVRQLTSFVTRTGRTTTPSPPAPPNSPTTLR
jgi:uncharacterized membrane protein